MEKIRVDVWLWATRQVKSRSLATAAAKAGHVKINGVSAKPSASVCVGDEIKLRVNGFDKVLRVLAIIPKRVGAPLAVKCYKEVTPPKAVDPSAGAFIYRPRGTGRPTKKERRQLDKLRGYDAR